MKRRETSNERYRRFSNRLEILQIAKAVAEEKSIDQKIVIEAMQEAIEKAAKAKYGQEHDIRATIDPVTGEQTLLRVLTVVPDEEFEDEAKQLRLAEAKKIDASLEIGSELTEELPPFDFGRVAAQTAKQVIMQKVRDAERERQYNEYKDRVGEIISGVVKRVEYGHVIVDLGRAEASSAAMTVSRARTSSRTTACVPISTRSPARPRARRSSCRALRLTSWSACSLRKYRKSMKA